MDSTMKKSLSLANLKRAGEVLVKVKQAIDPNAFIAGGFATSVYLGRTWYSSDVDIFFSSPNFEVDPHGSSAFKQLEAVFPGISQAPKETYWYNNRFCRIASKNGIDFIQIKNAPEHDVHDYVLEKFDLNVCKVVMDISSNEWKNEGPDYVRMIPSQDFIEAINTKVMKYDLNLGDGLAECRAQAKVTLDRLEKYKERFPEFKVVQINENKFGKNDGASDDNQ